MSAPPSRGAGLMARKTPDAMPMPGDDAGGDTNESGETYKVTRDEAASLLADGDVTTSTGCHLVLDDGQATDDSAAGAPPVDDTQGM